MRFAGRERAGTRSMTLNISPEQELHRSDGVRYTSCRDSHVRTNHKSAGRLKIFLSVTSLDTRYGGPAYSVGRLAAALAESGVEVGLWTPDGSAVDAGFNVVPLVAANPVRKFQCGLNAAVALFGSPDVFHDNGIWMPHNHRIAKIASRRGIPRVVSTRGMLEPWARAHKRFKKSIAWPLYQRRDLECATLLHATSDVEKANLMSYSLRPEVSVIPNGVDIPDDVSVELPASDRSNEKTALFVGRLYPVKGLPSLIQAWSSVVPHGWKLVIAGPDEGGHLAQLKRLVAAAGLEGVISFVGHVEGRAKRALFLSANLFVLPTQSESFGMAIAESLSYGVPVLTTTAAPWPLLDGSCGWRVPPDMVGLANGLALATSIDTEMLAIMGQRGREIVMERFQWKNVASLFIAEYERLGRRR